MEAVITKANAADLPAVAQIYEDIIARQDRGGPYIGWQSGVYPLSLIHISEPTRPY